jgi:hypothetical protein
MKKEHPVLGGLLALACIYAFAYALRSWIHDPTGFGIGRGWSVLIFIGFIVCFSLICWSLTAWQRHRREAFESKRLCPHGIPGGETRDRCVTCIKEREDENDQREKERQERQRLQRIKEAADSLRHEELKRLAKARVGKLDFLMTGTPQEFEDTVAAMFEKLGYSVNQTPYSSDHGKDAIGTKDGKKMLIECKRYQRDNLIGRPALQKFYAAIMEEKADKGFFVTTSGFARTALEYEYVRSNLIELIDGETLAHMMIRAFPDTSDSEKYSVMCLQCGCEVIFDLLGGESQKLCSNSHPVNNDLRSEMLSLKLVSGKVYCEKCGREMRRIHGRRGDFWGCTGYPTCRSTRSIRQGEPQH